MAQKVDIGAAVGAEGQGAGMEGKRQTIRGGLLGVWHRGLA